MFSKQLKLDHGINIHNHEFFHACLDRIDILMTEKNSSVHKSQILAILSELAYFKPKKD